MRDDCGDLLIFKHRHSVWLRFQCDLINGNSRRLCSDDDVTAESAANVFRSANFGGSPTSPTFIFQNSPPSNLSSSVLLTRRRRDQFQLLIQRSIPQQQSQNEQNKCSRPWSRPSPYGRRLPSRPCRLRGFISLRWRRKAIGMPTPLGTSGSISYYTSKVISRVQSWKMVKQVVFS